MIPPPFFLMFSFMAALSLFPSFSYAASFDCTKAGNFVEKSICSDEQLSKLDDSLAEVYKKAIKASSTEKELKRNQNNWLSKRNICKNNVCLKRFYEARIAYLRKGLSKQGTTSNPLSPGQPGETEISALPVETSLKRFLQTYDDDKETRYIAAFRDLNDDGRPEAIVYLISNEWCGSGGCTALILTQNGNSWRIVTKTTITRPPIRVLANISNGWHTIGVWVEGGGILPGYEAELRFNGKKYPSNPSVPPARPLKKGVEGEVVIPSMDNAVFLYDDQKK